jgi:hypothetical protein
MVGFLSLNELGEAEREGRTSFCTFRKVPSQASTANGWVDYSMAGGNPVPNFYAASPFEASFLDPFKGVFHGDDKAPYSKHLAKLLVVTPTAAMLGPVTLLDYLMFYPFIDGDAAGEIQTLTNPSAMPLTRSTDGLGVRVMAIVSAPTTGGGSFRYYYDDANGVAQVSPIINVNTAITNIASCLTGDPNSASNGAPFLPMGGDGNGVRRITDVEVITPIGGLFSLVLVNALGSTVMREVNTPYELEYVTMKPGLPRVFDGAFLNFIGNPAGSVAGGIFTGNAHFAWSK